MILSPLIKNKLLSSPIDSFAVSGLKTEPIRCPEGVVEGEAGDSYAVAERCIGNIKYFFKQPESATKERLDALWSDV